MKTIKIVWAVFQLALFVIVPTRNYSQTIINAGPVSGTWTANGSPYHIMGDIYVPTGNTLVIEPGITVKILAELSFKVYGKLLAEGMEGNTISFVPLSTFWKGLQILNSPDTCKLKYCNFNYFKKRTPVGSIKGGVIYISNSIANINYCHFEQNKIIFDIESDIIGRGGAICVENSIANLIGSHFIGNEIYQTNPSINSEGFGGAIYSNGGKTNLIDCSVTNNVINLIVNVWDAGCIAKAYSGGIYLSNNNVNCSVENIQIYGNSCITFASSSSLENWSLAESYSYGGGIYSYNSEIKNNQVWGNLCESHADCYYTMYSTGSAFAGSFGGGIYCSNGTVVNNLIFNNSCQALIPWIPYTYNEVGGGGIYGGNVINSTIVENNINECFIKNGSGAGDCQLINSIVFNNEGNGDQVTGNASYSCIEGGYSGQGNTAENPLFVAGPNGNFYLSQIHAGQSQQSPCVNAGDPLSNQIPGTTRTDEIADTGMVDMGFHYHCEAKILANFGVDTSCGLVPFNVQFENQSFFSLCEPVLRTWDFENDGVIDSFEEDPTWTYSQPGNYSVSLIVIALDENNEFITDTILKESCIQSFMIDSDFSQDIYYGLAPLSVNFFDASLAENTEIGGWQWDFQNDGIIDSYEQNPAFIYDEPGIYSVKLIIQETSLIFSDTALKEGQIKVCNLQPGFYAEPLSGSIPLQVQFFDTIEVEFTQIGTWEWDFDNDGITDSDDQNPEWTFDQVGKFSIGLIVRDTSQTIVKILTKEDYIETFSSGIETNTSHNSTKLKVFPNPFTNNLIIGFDSEDNETIKLTVYDVNLNLVKKLADSEKVGKGLKTWKWENNSEGSPAGVYFITLTTNSGNQFLKKCIKID